MGHKEWIVGYGFITPVLIIFIVFLLYPIAYDLFLSFHRWNGLGPIQFIGTANYARLSQDPNFINALKNTFIWIILTTIIPVTLGLAIATLSELARKRTTVFRAVIFAPMAISATASGIIWTFMYDPDYGLINSLLKAIKLDSLARPWLGCPETALYAVIVAYVWVWTGFCMVVIHAGLKRIPASMLEAARIDGANDWQMFKCILLPQLRSTLGVVALMTMVSSLKVFDLIYTMTAGGPFRSSEVLAFFMYIESFYHYKMGYGAAIALLLLTMVLIVSVPLIRLIRRMEEQ